MRPGSCTTATSRPARSTGWARAIPHSFYDPYSKAARDMYWRQVNERLDVLGVDAWWMDATEPDLHSNLDIDSIKQRIGPTAIGLGRPSTSTPTRWCIRAACTKERVPRDPTSACSSSRARDSRAYSATPRPCGAATSPRAGDDLYDQISAGVSVGYAGLPNWTFDIGGFANEARYSTQKPKAEDLEEWRELNLRWFQFGAFAPLFRSHGEFPLREIYNLAPPQESKSTAEVFDSLVWHDKLRYRLLPYTYTVAADTYHRDGTIMRGLSDGFRGRPGSPRRAR